MVLRQVAGDEPVPVAGHAALLDLQAAPPERAARQLHRAARVLAAALGVDRQRATQGVQAEQGVRARDELDARDGRLRQQVPVHHVAERLVDAHAVLEHRQALRHPHQRRGGEAAKGDVQLVRVALCRVHGDAARVALQELRQVALALFAHLLAGVDLHVGRHVAQRRAQARQGCGTDHIDLGQLQRLGRVVGGQGGRRTGEGERKRCQGLHWMHGCLLCRGRCFVPCGASSMPLDNAGQQAGS